ncbi:acylneuraminate cytidylyltransferase [Microbacterium sp. Leaf159]|nr:acylneuraminate cytidylyltransferase [Microbacterium sp. Leaf159]
MTSTRLPGKVLLRAAGRTMLDHHLDRLIQTGVPVIVATTTNDSDDPIASLARQRGVTAYRGSEDDVLARFAGAASDSGVDTIVRVTSDCPLIDPSLIAEGLRLYDALDDPYAHVSNVIERTYPRGFDFEVFSTVALVEAHENAREPAEREHVTPYLYAGRSGRTSLHAVTQEDDASGYRVTLDTSEDLVLIRELIESYDASTLSAREIVAVLKQHPELVAINAHVEQKKLGE